MKKLLLILALASATAFAGVTVTTIHDTAVYKPATATTATTLHDKDGVTALDQCKALGLALGPDAKYTCTDVYGFTNVADCANVKAPKVYLTKEKSAEDGKDYWIEPGASWTDGTFIEMADLYVHNAAWPAGVPNCWVPGKAVRDEWRLNSKDEPGKAFMEIRMPDMPPGDLVAEEPSEMEPTWHTPEQKAALDAFNTEWQAREDAAAAACANGDKTQCPPQPVLVGACGDYRSPECGPGILPGVNDNATLGISP